MTRPALSDEAYRRTEGVLFRYAEAKQKIARLEAEIAELERQITNIEKLIAACGATPGSMVANYSGMPAGGNSATVVERAVILSETRLTHLQAMFQERSTKRDQKLDKLYALRDETMPIEFEYQQMEQQDQAVFVQRYFYERSNVQIGIQLRKDESCIRDQLKKIVRRFVTLLDDAA